MGNRAVITMSKAKDVSKSTDTGIYLHWNGGRDSVEAFLTYCKYRGFRDGDYGMARLTQIISNFFGGGLSIGVGACCNLDCDNYDNGVYIVEDWEIVGRQFFNGVEQNSYDLNEMLLAIDEKQPESDRIGDFLKAETVVTTDINIGDCVVRFDWNGTLEKGVVIGFGSGVVNGTCVNGIPYCDFFGNEHPEKNINNYLTGAYRRIKPEEPKAEPEQTAPEAVEVYINEKLKGVEIKFTKKPSAEVRETLKAKGFKWHNKKCVWYAKNSPEALAVAQEIAKAAVK